MCRPAAEGLLIAASKGLEMSAAALSTLAQIQQLTRMLRAEEQSAGRTLLSLAGALYGKCLG